MRPYLGHLCCTAIVCSFFFLTSCSSHQKTVKHPATARPDSGLAASEAPCILPSGDVKDAEESTLAEPEESAKEEIAALNRPGAWETGARPLSGIGAQATGYEISGYDFPVTINKQVNYYLELFQGKQRGMFARWLARSSRYVPAIEKELIKGGLPRDLAFLAMIESGYNPSAVSCAGAGGLWQFMPATGRQYNLAINSWVDERRQPDKATKAAISYLSRLYKQFNDWHLAVAAYNTGEGKIERAIKTHGTADFWELAASEGIYMETKRYVPKLIAAIIIARNPEAYGFDSIDYQSAHSYEVVHVPASTDLSAVARTVNTTVKHLRTLNNELLKNQTPPTYKQYALRVPPGCKGLVAANIDNLRLRPTQTNIAYATHVVKKGETLQAISKRYQVSMTALLKSNKLRVSSLKIGQRLQIPVAADTMHIAQRTKQPEKQVAGGGKIQAQQRYRVQKGDTLDQIARKHGVSVDQLKKWNAIKDSRSLQFGQQLTLHSSKSNATPMLAANPTRIALTSTVKESATKTSAASAPAKPKESVAVALKATSTGKSEAARNATQPQPAVRQAAKKPNAQKSWYVVKNGDSMWTIAKKFSVSVDEIRQWNNLSSNNTLKIGNRLLVRNG